MMSGNRTGSEVGLYNYICHADRQKLRVGVACPGRGELLAHLPADVPVFDTSAPGPGGLHRRLARKLSLGRLARVEDPVLAASRAYGADAWYVNTIIQPELLRLARRAGVPCVLHTHELEQMLWNLSEEEARDLVEVPKLVVAGSRAAAAVVRQLGRTGAVEVCYETIDSAKINADAGRAAAVRARLGAGEKTFVWAMSGSLDPNKNPVAFTDAAGELLARGHDAHFLWIGGAGRGYGLYARRRAEAMGLSGRVTWAGALSGDDYYDHLNAADGFALTSTRESFSIVTVEAAYLGKPVVAFDCVGVREIVTEAVGEVVDSLNTRDLVGAMERVMRGQTRHDPAAARARALGFDISAHVGHWQRSLETHLGAAA